MRVRELVITVVALTTLAASGCGPTMHGDGMMGSTDPGRVMGRQLANVAGDRVSADEAERLGSEMPEGAAVDRATRRIVFRSAEVRLAAVAAPRHGAQMSFRLAGLTNPIVEVRNGAKVAVQFINADADMAHGWVITQASPPYPYMAMMEVPAAFAQSHGMPLGDATAAGMPSVTIGFSANGVGEYWYICPIAGHAKQGMYGKFVVVAPG